MSGETVFSMVLLALLIGGIIVFYGVRLVQEAKGLWQALRALRDKIDGTKRWP